MGIDKEEFFYIVTKYAPLAKKYEEDECLLPGGGASASGGQGVPVRPEVARGFLEACRQEYVYGREAAVGTFFDGGLSSFDVDALVPFETRIQAAPDKSGAIEQLAR